MQPEINGIQLDHRKGLWFGDVPSKTYGNLEAVLDGSKDAPDPMQAEALRRFSQEAFALGHSQVGCGFVLQAQHVASVGVIADLAFKGHVAARAIVRTGRGADRLVGEQEGHAILPPRAARAARGRRRSARRHHPRTLRSERPG